jgi:hypothetical protein
LNQLNSVPPFLSVSSYRCRLHTDTASEISLRRTSVFFRALAAGPYQLDAHLGTVLKHDGL